MTRIRYIILRQTASQCTAQQCNALTLPYNSHTVGDLDGDIFFVCWDPDLIPHQSCLHSAMSYSAAAEKPHGKVGTADRIKYFTNHQPSVLGKLDKCYQQWANLKGVACRECAQLADLFSFGVDSVKTGEQCSACESGAHGGKKHHLMCTACKAASMLHQSKTCCSYR